MGWTSSWIAVENVDASEVLAYLGLAETGEVLDEWFDPGLCWVRLQNWVVVFFDGMHNFDRVSAEQARAFSTFCPVLFLIQSDYDMCDSLTCFVEGGVAWEVDHRDGQAESPFVTGSPPEQLAPILAEQRRKQAEGDGTVSYLYEVAPELGLALTGFRHDAPDGDDGFHVVE